MYNSHTLLCSMLHGDFLEVGTKQVHTKSFPCISHFAAFCVTKKSCRPLRCNVVLFKVYFVPLPLSHSNKLNWIIFTLVGLTTVTPTPEPAVLNTGDFICMLVKPLVNSPVLFPEALNFPLSCGIHREMRNTLLMCWCLNLVPYRPVAT